MIATLFATLPTQDFLGNPFEGPWAGFAWAHGLNKALAEALVSSTDEEKSLVALRCTLLNLDYTLWTRCRAKTPVVSSSEEYLS